ncbi:MAG TPA: sulfite exporter TauE/SafE family protein [Rectinemataceae bacterium]|nr:sulfite exporter TauE/SafE family protein [Rectinemataceae bacterium]
MKEYVLHIDGMTCHSCEKRIEAALTGIGGVEAAKASQSDARAVVRHDGSVDEASLRAAVERAGYVVRERPSHSTPIALGIGLVFAALYMVANAMGVFNSFPMADSSIGYGMLLVIGLLTSVHCVAMCGGIAISQSLRTIDARPAKATSGASVVTAAMAPSLGRLVPGFLYNGGRVISYTIVGAIIGGLGSAFSFSETTKGAITALAGFFMLWLGLKMIGIMPSLPPGPGFLPPTLKRRIAAFTSKFVGRGPFIVGLLGGLMPCGPLQTMQLYALGTGSIAAGAFSMFLFSLGTVPLMLVFGAAATILPRKFMPVMIKASAVLVLLLGALTLGRAAALAGIALPDPFGAGGLRGLQASVVAPGLAPGLAQNAAYDRAGAKGGLVAAGISEAAAGSVRGSASPDGGGATAVTGGSDDIPRARIEGGFQTVVTVFGSNNYMPFYVQAGLPVHWIIRIKKEDITGCNRTVIVPAYRIRKDLQPGDNLIVFTPTKAGIVPYSCWMGMIRSAFGVVEDLGKIKSSLQIAPGGQGGQGAGGPRSQTPAGPASLAAALAMPGSAGVSPEAALGEASGSGDAESGGGAGVSSAGLDLSTIGIPKIRNGIQEITIRVDEDRYSPEVIVLQKGMKAVIHFQPLRLDGCNSVVFFPELNGGLDLARGQLSTPEIPVSADFTFNCSMNMLHGYAKVVDSLSKVKLDEVRKELADYSVSTDSCCDN